MNTKSFMSMFAFVLASVFLIGAVGASITSTSTDLLLTSTSPISFNVMHGTTSTFSPTFNLTNNNQTSSYNLIWTNSEDSIITWITWASFSALNIPIEKLTTNKPLSGAFTATVPARTIPGLYTSTLQVDGTNVNDNLITSTQSLTYTINVTSSPSFTATRNTDIVTRTGTGTFTLINTGNVPLTLALSSSGAFNTLFYEGLTSTTPITSVSLPASTPTFTQPGKTIKVVPTNLPTAFNFGDNVVTIVANDSSQKVQQSISFAIHEGFCKPAAGSNLTVDNVEVTNDGQGDDSEWFLLDSIRVRADVNNIGATDLEDIYTVLGIFDSTGKNIVSKMTFIDSKDDEKLKVGDIDSGDDKRANYEFKIPGDVKTGTYSLVVKAYSKKSGESVVCADSSTQSIKIQTQDDSGKYIGFDNIQLSDAQVACGDTLTLDLEAVNVGEDDQDQVKVTLYNKDLGINQAVEIKQGLDIGDVQPISFTFQIPSGVQDKSYNLELSSEYDYSDGVYEQSSDTTEIVSVKVFGCAPSQETGSFAAISASLQSDAKPNEDLIVAVTVKNTGASSGQFTIDVRGYSGWAILNSISDRLITLNAGESKTLQLNLLPNAEIFGEQTFTIGVTSGANTQSKSVSVEFPAKSGNVLGSLKGNSLIWIIALVNVILIVLIIIVAVKLSKN